MSILVSARLLTEEREPSAPAASAAMEVEEDDFDWVGDVYRQLNGAPNRNRSTRGQRLKTYRILIGLLSGALGLFGAAVLVWFSGCLFSALPFVAFSCSSSGTLALIAGSLLLLTSIVGCVVGCYGKRSSLLVCLAALLLLYGVLCGALVSFLFYARLRELDGLQESWAKMVAAQPDMVCDLQKQLKCAGFKESECCRGVSLDEVVFGVAFMAPTACYLEASNGTTLDMRTLEKADWPRTMCASQCSSENAKYGQTCEAELKSVLKLKFYRLAFLPSLCTVLFLILSGITMASVRLKPRTRNYVRHRF
ncbi:hypothetical protein LSCM1_02492 [Leishmania martiniquensis]|uniref:Tetraspanin family protein n=1 Tax=Leishmania martiniquensis TaxID=1580590 RepID=A0A836GKC3_9TRYP|nr:hypothetical protein LSCM1_02492 [Leishmania martiniquensis]